MDAEGYLGKSRLFRRLKNGPHGQLIDRYTARVVKDGLARQGMWRCLNLVSGLLSWLSRRRLEMTGFDERALEQYLTYRARKKSIQPSDRAAPTRLPSVLRDTNVIPPAPLPPIPPEDQILRKFANYLRDERGLAPKSILRHLPVIRMFLRELRPAGAVDLGKIRQNNVVRYVERHAHDSSVASGKAMCTALRALLRYLYYDGSNPLALAGCVPSVRHCKLANLPTYSPAAQVLKVLDDCDRTTGLGRRDYAIVLMLARLGLRASEVAPSLWMISTGVQGRCSFTQRGGKRHRCRCHLTSARSLWPICDVTARCHRVAGCLSAHLRPTLASHRVVLLR